jgi:hypothetical protein
MTNNRGTLLQVPIRFKAHTSLVLWEINHDHATAVFEGGALTGWSSMGKLEDVWELLRQFLKLPTDDEEAILNFLLEHGTFGSPIQEHVESIVLPIRIPAPGERLPRTPVILERVPRQAFATLQEYLRRMLLSANPTLATPWKSIQQYSICFTKTRLGPQAEVSIRGAFPAMLAVAQFKLAQGATFRACARKDCRLPFEISSRHKRKFCTQYCAHITSLRSRRKVQQASKRIKAESLHTKGQ